MAVLLALLLLWLGLAAPQTSAFSDASTCTNASTLVKDSDSQATVYDSSCNARNFQVVVSSSVERSLNLSNLDVVDVRSYPRVYQLLLNHNELETFAPTEADNDMEDLELNNNFISDLSAFNFPQRLNYLDLSSNSISTLSEATPWPESFELQTLLLNDNTLSSVGAETFVDLVALQALSLSNTGISNLDDLELPVSLRTLNATNNAFTSASTNFSQLPVALQYLDLSSNLLTTFPSIVSSLSTLVELNLESNGIKKISGVSFASTLRKLYLDGNPLATIEICRSDVSVFQSLTELSAPSSISSSCSNPSASLEEIQGVNFCVLEDDECLASSTSGSASATSEPTADIGSISGDSSSDSSTSSTTSSGSSSIFSAEAIGIIGSTFFLVGILLSALVFGLIRRRQKSSEDNSRPEKKRRRGHRAPSSGHNFVVFGSSGGMRRGNDSITDEDGANATGHDPYSDTRDSEYHVSMETPEHEWGFVSPGDKYNPVAILEESPKGHAGRHGDAPASLQVRSKFKSNIDMDDLLVYEIPPEEIQMRRALRTASVGKKSSKAALALSSVGVGSSRKEERALFLAEYQGYKVVIHALQRQRKRSERRFVEQIRLAASLDHASIVHFIGITTGCSSTASRRRGSSAAAPPAGSYFDGARSSASTYRMGNSRTGSGYKPSASKSRYSSMGAPSWHLGVVFEFMHHGSLAAMFEAERNRREGKHFYPNGSVASRIGSGGGDIFSWYPVFAGQSSNGASGGPNANPNADWRCKLSIALDVAMGLVYLHSNNLAHGHLCARKVLVNEHGEAKLSALDVQLPSDLTPKKKKALDQRGSLRESALWTVQKLAGFRMSSASMSSDVMGKSRVRSANASKRRQPSFMGGRSRQANDSNESDVSSVTVGGSSALDEDDNSLGESGLSEVMLSAQRADVYAFGTFLWELDTMIAVEEDLSGSGTSCRSSERGDPLLLKFSADCPRELERLARQCWTQDPDERPDAIDVQEELVRVLEGRLTASSHVPNNWSRPTSASALSSLESSEFSDSSLPSSCSVLAISVADL